MDHFKNVNRHSHGRTGLIRSFIADFAGLICLILIVAVGLMIADAM